MHVGRLGPGGRLSCTHHTSPANPPLARHLQYTGFAILYMLEPAGCITEVSQFLHALWFSVHTSATIGYGHMYAGASGGRSPRLEGGLDAGMHVPACCGPGDVLWTASGRPQHPPPCVMGSEHASMGLAGGEASTPRRTQSGARPPTCRAPDPDCKSTNFIILCEVLTTCLLQASLLGVVYARFRCGVQGADGGAAGGVGAPCPVRGMPEPGEGC